MRNQESPKEWKTQNLLFVRKADEKGPKRKMG